MWRSSAAVACLLVLALSCAGCAGGGSAFNGPPIARASHVVYLDVEDAETLQGPSGTSIGETLRYRAMPPLATFYGASVYSPTCLGSFTGCGSGIGAPGPALESAVRSLSPTVATVEAGLAPLGNGVGATSFASELGGLLGDLRLAGVRTVLVANLAPWNLAPSASSFVASPTAFGLEIAAYNKAIATVAARYGAVLVNLHSIVGRAIALRGAASVFTVPAGFSTAPFALNAYAWGLVERAYLAELSHHSPRGPRRTG